MNSKYSKFKRKIAFKAIHSALKVLSSQLPENYKFLNVVKRSYASDKLKYDEFTQGKIVDRLKDLRAAFADYVERVDPRNHHYLLDFRYNDDKRIITSLESSYIEEEDLFKNLDAYILDALRNAADTDAYQAEKFRTGY